MLTLVNLLGKNALAIISSRLYPTTSRRSIRIRIYSWQKVVQTDHALYMTARPHGLSIAFQRYSSNLICSSRGDYTTKKAEKPLNILTLKSRSTDYVANSLLFSQQRHTRRHPCYNLWRILLLRQRPSA